MAGEEIGAAAGGTSALSIIGPVGSAAGMAFSIYSSIKTNEFRKELLNKLSEISNQVTSLSNEFRAFESEHKLSNELAVYKNPIVKIYSSYDDVFVKKTYDDSDLPNIDSAMNNVIDLINYNKADLLGDLLVNLVLAYWESKSESQLTQNVNNSVIEMTYSFFYNRVVPSLTIGYAILVHEKYNAKGNPNMLSNWKKDLASNVNQKPSLLASIMSKTQSAVNKYAASNNAISWINLRELENTNGKPDVNFKQEQLRYVLIGENQQFPDDHVITGYEFAKVTLENGHTALQLILHHGAIDEYGYVADVKKTSQGFMAADCTTPEYMHKLEDVRMIFTGKIEVPDGNLETPKKLYALTNLAFVVHKNDFPKWSKRNNGKHYTLKTQILSLQIEYGEVVRAPQIESKMTVINKRKTSGIMLDDHELVIRSVFEPILHALESKGGATNPTAKGFDFFNSDKEWFHTQHRNFYIPKNLDTSGWNVPITGVEIRNSHLSFKSDFHKNMFSK